MPPSTELRLLSKILDKGDLRPLLERGVTIDHFKTDQGKAIYKRIWKYYNSRTTPGEVPSRILIEQEWPKEDWPTKDRSSLNAVLEQFLSEHITTELSNLGTYLLDNCSDHQTAMRVLEEQYALLTRTRRLTEDRVLSASVEQVVAAYEQNRDNTGYRGIPYPWEVLNYETGGMLNGEFVILYGRPKSMKTWLLLNCACHAYDYASRRVLICTREMTPQQILNRCVCILIRCPYSAWQHGTMREIPVPEGGTMEDRFYSLMECIVQDEQTCLLDTGHGKSLIITSDRADPSGGGVSGLRQKVKDHSPEALYVDAMYLMKDDRENRKSVKWYNQAAISQDLKDLALDFNLPVMGTNQATRDSEDKAGKAVSNIAFADAYGMDCDLAMEIIKKPTANKEVNELALAITAAREINMTGFAVNGNAASDFGQMMTRSLDDSGGYSHDEDGNPILHPVTFQEYSDLKAFFKGEEMDQKTKDASRKEAKEAWRDLNAQGKRRS